MDSAEEKQSQASQQPVSCNPAEPYGQQSLYRNPAQLPVYRNPAEPYLQTASTQGAYGSSLNSETQNAEKNARFLLRSAGNTASLIPIIEQLILTALLFIVFFGWMFANLNQFLPAIKSGNTQEITNSLLAADSGVTALILDIIALIPASIITILITRSMLHYKIKEQLKRPSLGVPEFFLYLVVAYGIAGAGEFLSLVMQTLFEKFQLKVTTPNFSLAGNNVQNALIILYVCLLGPIFEEILFRGLILQSLRPWGDKLAIIVSGVLFGLMHLNLTQGIPAALLGMFFGFVAVKCGSIVPTVILHIMYNSTTMVMELCGLETNESVQTGYLIFLGVMFIVSLILLVLRRIPFHEIRKQAAPNIVQPQHPYRVVFLQCAAFWVLAVLFVASSFLPMIMVTLYR
jgi:membrane protease YdiL (CAAX protease family)